MRRFLARHGWTIGSALILVGYAGSMSVAIWLLIVGPHT